MKCTCIYVYISDYICDMKYLSKIQTKETISQSLQYQHWKCHLVIRSHSKSYVLALTIFPVSALLLSKSRRSYKIKCSTGI